MAIRNRVRELRNVRAGDLVPDERNWRTHSDRQRNALSGMLAEIGYADACLVRELEDGRLCVIDGHLRASLDPEQMVPCLILDVDEAEAGKLLLTIDPLAGMAGCNTDLLASLAGSVEFETPGLDDMLRAILAENHVVQQPADGLTDPDAVPEVPQVVVVKLSDVWTIGEHRICCGDSTDPETVAKLLGERKPFIMVTDPPYGVEYDADWRNQVDNWGRTSRVGPVANDNRADWTEAYKLFPGDVAYVWHAGQHAADVVANLAAANFLIRTQIIWVKQNQVMSRGAYHYRHEPLWYSVRKGKTAKWCGDRTQTTTWEIRNANPCGGGSHDDCETTHSTQKPVECMLRPIRNHGGPDDDVFDPFIGSGTTAVAAHSLGRRCFGCELMPEYAQMAIERLERFAGLTAVLEGTGQTLAELKAAAPVATDAGG